jgi:hypothetical protein
MMACTSEGGVPKVGGISEASTTPSRPLVPAPTKITRPPFLSACVMISTPCAIRSFSFSTALMTLRSSLTTISMISRTGALSMASETVLIASVGRDCHFEWVGIATAFRRPPAPRGFEHATAYGTPASHGCQFRRGPSSAVHVRTTAPGYTLAAVTIDAYLIYLRDVRRMSPNTVESYARDLAALAAFAATLERDVSSLDRKDLEAFVRSLMAGGLSPRSVARTVACVRGFYRFHAVDERQETSPAGDLRAPRGWAALPKFLDLEEVDRLLAVPDVSTPRGLRDKTMIAVLYATGLRVSELVALKLSDLHFDEGYVTCVGKGSKERIVPIGEDASGWVRRISAKAGNDSSRVHHPGCS